MPNQSPTITGRGWYYADAERQTVGPLTEDHLRLLRLNGTIADNTLIVPEGSEEWRPYRSVFGKAEVQPPPLPARPIRTVPPTVPCPFCAEPISLAAKKCKHCGEILDHSLRAAQQTGRNANAPRPKRKIGCLKLLGILFLLFFAFSILTSIVGTKTSSTAAPAARRSSVAPPERSMAQSNLADYESGVLTGEAHGKEWASQDGGRPYPEGIRLMARNHQVDDPKPKNQEQWIKGFEAGFNRAWDSIRGKRNTEAYTKLSWGTAQTGALLYDFNERHRATLIMPDRDTGKILVRYVKDGSIERKDLKAMARFWFVRREPPSVPELSKLQPSDVPKHVSLKSEMVFELPGGKGTATAPSGTRVEVVQRSHDKLRIRFMDAEKEILSQETSFEEEVRAAFSRKQQQERQEIERLAALEKAKQDAQKAEAKALRAKIIADAGKEPEDTAARVLVRLHLARRLSDPPSVKYESWSKVQYTEYRDGKYAWCITVDYRFKNAFGGYVRYQHTGYIRNERLIAFE